MSHIETMEVTITNMGALKEAVRELGGLLFEHQKTFRWYNSEAPQACDAAIGFPGADYEVGVRRKDDGTMELLWDPWESGMLQTVLGKGAHKLTQCYMKHNLKAECKKARKLFKEERLPDRIRLTITM